jgi:hypothetical protein
MIRIIAEGWTGRKYLLGLGGWDLPISEQNSVEKVVIYYFQHAEGI